MADLRPKVRNIAALARQLDVDYSHLHAVLRGEDRPGPKLAIRIEQATAGAIQRWELRPDLWSPPTGLVA